MKTWIKPSKVEWYSFLLIMPVLSLVLNYIFFGSRLWTDYRILLFSFPILYIIGFISWYSHIVVMYRLRIIYPNIQQTTIRLVLLALAHISLTTLTFAFQFYGYDSIHFLDYKFVWVDFKFSLIVALVLTMIATTLWESEFTSAQWKAGIAEKIKLQQMAISMEFETLKSQVNPHFLFNCFNTLSSLISEDRKAAEAFLHELSKVYRYLLKNNTAAMTNVQSEIKFIESYYRLLQTRHGSALEIKIEVDKKYYNYMVPALSMQMLVENAVKHNALSKTHPLQVDIFTTAGNRLIVSNNKRRRNNIGVSNKVGLENIRNKYYLVNQEGFSIIQDEKNFSVVLPLIWSKTPEHNTLTYETVTK